MNAIDRLKLFLKNQPKKYIKTSTIIKWGVDYGYSNRACRNARQLANEGFLRRISREEAILSNFNTKEGIYEIL